MQSCPVTECLAAKPKCKNCKIRLEAISRPGPRTHIDPKKVMIKITSKEIQRWLKNA